MAKNQYFNFRRGGAMIALLLTVCVVSAQNQYNNYAFPSPMPPTGNTADVKQIVSFIWDDNAYSGKNGTNYEGPKWIADPKFANVGWVGGRREEAGHIFLPPGSGLAGNDMNLSEGDFGMAWAAKVLTGYGKNQISTNYFFNPQFWQGYTYKQGDTVIAYSEKAKKLKVYKIVASPYNSPLSNGWVSGKTFDEYAADPDDEVEVPIYWGATEKVLKKFSNLSETEINGSGKVFMTISDEAIVKGAPAKKNPDGSNITMTFNIISGQIIPAVNRGSGNQDHSANRESKWGYWIPNSLYSSTVFSGVAISWGREYPIFLNSWSSEKDKQLKSGYYMDNVSGDGLVGRMQVTGYLNIAYQEAADLGHEIGNHTIDHLETNSMLPYNIGSGATAFPGIANASTAFQGTAYKQGFGKWGGDGYDSEGIDRATMPDGEVLEVNEATSFGQTQGAPQQYMGWVSYAGKILSKAAWEGLIEIGEDEIHNYLDISKQNGNVLAFRAPRLEVNSNMFWALKGLGYLYDCGNEEGYEYNMNGTNYLWPYTMDNGSPNVAWQRMVGENKSNFDSLPYGLWQFPVSVLIIPQEYRQSVWNNYKQIALAEGENPTADDETSFMNVGKITGFDFNLFILNGASKEAAIATMRHSLDQRMSGGKAPMQIGCHTDYFTPIYDNATLLNSANKSTYGLVITNNWNSWRDRIAVWEDIRDYGLSKGAYFWDGKKTIDYVKELVAAVRVGSTETPITDIGAWEFFTHNNKSQTSGDINAATITTQSADWEQAGYAVYGDAGEFEFDHISLEYSTSAPLTIRLITDDPIDEEYPYEVTLNNLNGWDESVANKSRYVNSGQIPISAFQRNQYVGDVYPELVGLQAVGTNFTRSITGIEVAVQVPHDKAQRTYLSIKNFTLFSGEQTQGQKTGIVKGQKALAQRIAVQGMTANALKLNLAQKGVYSVDVISLNGRVVKSFKDVNMSVGLNTLPLNSIAKGLYMIRIHNKNFNISLKSPVL